MSTLIERRLRGDTISDIHWRIANNLRGYSFVDRHGRATAAERLRRQTAYDDLARELRQALIDQDSTAAVDSLNAAYRWIDRNDSCWIEFLESKFGGDYVACYDCGEIVDYYDSSNLDNEYRICESCADNYHWSEYRECYTADDDDNDGDREYSNIGNYHSSRHELGHIPSKYDSRRPRVLLGLELEMEINSSFDLNEKAEELLCHLGHTPDHRQYALLEHDGSITHGFEMVSGYTGLDIHAKQLAFFKNRFSGAKSHNTSTCGLHVHVCKAGMSMLHAAKMILFINDPNNQELIKAIARRDSSGYAKFQNKAEDKSWIKDARRYSSKAAQLAHLNADRYEALNFQNEKTIEFRLFKGTLKYQTIMACLEFSFITWFFARDTSQAQLNTENFLKYICLENNRRDTPYLRAYLIEKGFVLPFQQKPRPATAAATINQEEI
jgi:Putative amidoligase enzyme